MINRWNEGRDTITQMVTDGQLERVTASRDDAESLLQQAATRLASARLVLDGGDVATAGVVAYDSARVALNAVLVNQGLRVTSRGGHIAISQAVGAQLGDGGPRRIAPFDRMRRQRNNAEYRSVETLPLGREDVEADITTTEGLLAIARQLVDTMPPFS